MKSGEDVVVEGFFHIIDSLKPGLIIGMDTIIPYKFEFDMPGGKYWINTANRREGRLLCTRDLRHFQRPVKVAENVSIRPGKHQHIPVKFDHFDDDRDMYFTGKTFLNSSFGEYGKAANHLISKNTTAVRFGNLGKTPIKLKKGAICGIVEKVDEDDTMILMGHCDAQGTPVFESEPTYSTETSIGGCSILKKVPNPWSSRSWVQARASKKNSLLDSDF